MMTTGQKVDIFDNDYFLSFEYFRRLKNSKTIEFRQLSIWMFKKWIFWLKINEKSKIEILKITIFAKNIH